MSDVHKLSVRAALDALGSGEAGLPAAEARARLESHGRNELKVTGDTPEIVKFLRQFRIVLVGECFIRIEAG